MGTFDSVYKNKIRQLEEENKQLRKILREAEAGQVYPPNPIIPTPQQSGPLAPVRGYPGYTPEGKPTGWHTPMDVPYWAKPEYGPWRLNPDGEPYPWQPIGMPSLAPNIPPSSRPFGPNDLYREKPPYTY